MIQFGGQLPEIFDSSAQISVRPRCMGSLDLQVRDPNTYNGAIQQSGEDALMGWVKQVVMKHIGMVFAELASAGSVLKAMSSRDLAEKANAAVNQELAQIGATVHIDSINVNLSEEDIGALKQASAQAAMRKREQALTPTELAAGTRVIARWTDGREFPATIQKWTGTHYEITWDGGSNAFVAKDAVRPA